MYTLNESIENYSSVMNLIQIFEEEIFNGQELLWNAFYNDHKKGSPIPLCEWLSSIDSVAYSEVVNSINNYSNLKDLNKCPNVSVLYLLIQVINSEKNIDRSVIYKYLSCCKEKIEEECKGVQKILNTIAQYSPDSMRSIDNELEELNNCTNMDSYNEFLNNHPQTKYASLVEKIKENIQNQRREDLILFGQKIVEKRKK